MNDSWFDVATESRKAANRLVSDSFRSCLSRAYYAVYSKITYDLTNVAGVSFPLGDEGPKHPGRTGTGGIRRLVVDQLTTLDASRRMKLSELIGRLYAMRCAADYHPSIRVDSRDAREAISIVNTVFDAF